MDRSRRLAALSLVLVVAALAIPGSAFAQASRT
jgi:hypothetical protein